MNKLTNTYKLFLERLNKKSLNDFMANIENLRKQDNYFKDIEKYINENICLDFITIFENELFIKEFYLDSQAKFLREKLNISQELDIVKTLVYCYNSNQREFNKNEEYLKLKEEMNKRGFIEQDILNKEELRKLDGLKCICVFDRDRIGILGSYEVKEEHEGKFIFNHFGICFLPKGHTKTGQILHSKFFYKLKEVLK